MLLLRSSVPRQLSSPSLIAVVAEDSLQPLGGSACWTLPTQHLFPYNNQALACHGRISDFTETLPQVFSAIAMKHDLP